MRSSHSDSAPLRAPPGAAAAAAGGGDDNDSLPSPVSIPSAPVSPMNKFGAAAALEAENGRLRAKIATLEAHDAKLRKAVSSMRVEMQATRAERVDADERRALISQRDHLASHNELLARRLDEAAGTRPPPSPGAEVDAAAEARLLRARVRLLEEGAATLREQLRDAAAQAAAVGGVGAISDGGGGAIGALAARDGEIASLRQQLQLAQQLSAARAAATPEAALAAAAAAGPSSSLVAQLQSRISELTQKLADKTRECEALRAQADGGGLVRELQSRLGASEADLQVLARPRHPDTHNGPHTLPHTRIHT